MDAPVGPVMDAPVGPVMDAPVGPVTLPPGLGPMTQLIPSQIRISPGVVPSTKVMGAEIRPVPVITPVTLTSPPKPPRGIRYLIPSSLKSSVKWKLISGGREISPTFIFDRSNV
jgi:hypothetical protein